MTGARNSPQDWAESDTGQVNQRAVSAAPYHDQQEACEASPGTHDKLEITLGILNSLFCFFLP